MNAQLFSYSTFRSLPSAKSSSNVCWKAFSTASAIIVAGLVSFGASDSAQAATLGANVKFFGDQDLFGRANGPNKDVYPADPTAGAALVGLQAGDVSFANQSFNHGFPFVPEADDFPGTDQIYRGEAKSGSLKDGYFNKGINGPQLLDLDYSDLVSSSAIKTFTLGIAADDFQFPTFGNAYTASLNGQDAPALAAILNSFNLTGPGGPRTQFFSIGIDPSVLNASHRLALSINQVGGADGDGWAVDFLSIGIEAKMDEPVAQDVPAPGVLPGLAVLGGTALFTRKRNGQASEDQVSEDQVSEDQVPEG
ncbi:MAG: hypothetical protein WA885_23780 [Phormidesmis sp.]